MQAFLQGGKIKAQDSDAKNKKDNKAKKERPKPWVEKYRPSKVEDVAYQDEVVKVLQNTMQNEDLPNMLFYGPPGTGKTSTILAASKELFGDMWRDRVLELNASDERGITVVRDKVKSFSQLTASGRRPDGRRCPPFKIVILDEADSMTHHAQAALRRTMEKQSRTTRFCLICNYVSRIIEPITSRCAKFRFKPLHADILETRLKEIGEKEDVELDKAAMAALLHTSEGDMRKAITYLQSAARLKSGESVTEQDIFEIAGVIPVSVLDELIEACKSDSYEKLEANVKGMIADGHSAAQLITQIHDVLIEMDELKDKQKAAVMERLAVVDKRLIDGADEYLQIMDLATVIMYQLNHAGG